MVKNKAMNFGDIFDKWERGKSSGYMKDLLRDNEVYGKNIETGNKKHGSAGQHRLRSKKPDDVLDIHGFTHDEAWLSLDRFFQKALSKDYRKLLIIHGKGNHSKGEAVLGKTVRDFIEQCPNAGESGFQKGAGGGTGATWVLLKK